MKITQASRCLRFYTQDGWTRQAVCDLLSGYRQLARVMPRYFDHRDPKGDSHSLDDGLPHFHCVYFAVYDTSDPFDPEALAEHEILPFRS